MSTRTTEAGREKREQILDFLRDYRSEHGYFPTQEEIQDALSLSRGVFLWHLGSLREQGYLSYQPRSFARTLRLSRRSRESLR